MALNVADYIRPRNEKNQEKQNVEPLFSAADSNEKRRADAWLKDRIMKASRVGKAISEEVELTPVLAELILERNPHNRSLSAKTVNDIVQDIQNGAYEFNGEPIIISNEGLLNDGQHRCTAVVEAAKSVRTIVTFGVSRESRMTVDQGRVRQVGDYLAMDEVENANIQAAAASLLMQYMRTGTVSGETRHRPTKQEIREFVLTHPELSDSVTAVPRKGSNIAGGISRLVFCHYVFAYHDRDAANHFIKRLVKGDNLASNDPIYVCRERLLNIRRAKIAEKIELIFRAFKAHLEGRELTRLQTLGVLPRLDGK